MSPYIFINDVIVGDFIVLNNLVWEVGRIEKEGRMGVHLQLWPPGETPDPRSSDTPIPNLVHNGWRREAKVRLVQSARVETGGFRPA